MLRFLFATAVLLSVLVTDTGDATAKLYDEHQAVRIRILDKVTARTRTFDLSVGNTVSYGKLRIKPRSCQKAAPIEEPESAAFLQIWEVDLQNERHWVFSGWMFASSPSLSAMDHPVYDVWVIDCKRPANASIQSEVIEKDSPADESENDTSDN